ncbi:MAG: MarR family transcriptional regulator [Lentisphaerae bacterium]|nr:MarR family transcriptional regulator [Lentisphaerota bacterium]
MKTHRRAVPATGPNAIIAQIARIHEQMNRLIIQELQRRNITGIVTSHGDILAALFEYEELAMAEVARLIRRDKSTVTALVNKLIEAGYLEKYQSATDRRVTCLRLTDQGRALEPDFRVISEILLQRVYRGFSTDDQQTLVALLNRLHANVQTQEPHAG